MNISAYLTATALATAIPTALCIYLVFLWYDYHSKADHFRRLSGPKSTSWLFGNGLEVRTAQRNWHVQGQYPEPFLTWIKEHGGAVHLRDSFRHAILLSDPKALQYVLLTNAANYTRDPSMQIYLNDLLLGVGLLGANRSVHSKYRKMLNPHFTAKQLKSFLPIISFQTQKTCATLAAHSMNQTPVNMTSVLQELTLSVIGLAAFGFNFEDCPHAHQAYGEYQVPPSPLLMMGMVTIPGFLHLPLREITQRRKVQDAIRHVINDVIQAKLTASMSAQPQDLLDLILPESTPQEAIAHTTTFLFAGHETSSAVLGWVLATLATDARVKALVREEYKAVVAKYETLESWDAIGELKYTLAVIHESMRLHTVANIVSSRIPQDDDRLPMADGTTLFLPKGTQLVFKIAAMHRNPAYWANPDEFIPERFVDHSTEWNADLDLRGGKSHAYFYLPFSAGSMNCIGYRFALTEMQLIVATLIGQFDFHLTANSDLGHFYTGAIHRPSKVEAKVQKQCV
ncbi:Aste57867_7578 [Aphanomyces stellatus]|uniref:Aste57867_1610 protein n=1 Tax=Aphanomyces stellatus TaxID=120398 RepID=A0A485KIK7_9STRA|nr:hypothetical protein As57867_007551 [Aphanomyces stellatus]KAF0718564.1 hypothetical protein As57867_001608 [Aphanomyces stellatus]VFT78823.1 Aste57867_1610 [Aphanomyces stellatus]VFT84486.1 Aste57867_7578 [Aphanomyces stellatus]